MPHRLLLPATALLLAAATLAAYQGLLANGFVNYDDDLYITSVPAVRAGLTLEGVRWAFGTFHGANWFPLTWLSWMLDVELFGLSPRAFHATSLALHVANVLLALLAFRRLTGSLGVAAFTAGVFALHPLHVESVAWASTRKDVLAGLFWMLGLLAYERWARRGPSPARGAAVVGCLLLGLMAKPVVVALPAVLLLLDVWPLRRLGGAGGWQAQHVRRVLLEKAPLFAITALFSLLVVVAQSAGGAMNPENRFPLGIRVGNALVACATYLRRAFWPDDLAVFYPHPGRSLEAAPVAAAAALLLGLALLAFWQRRRRPQLAVGLLWWLVVLIPAIGVVQVGQAALADRYSYLAQSGLVLALAATLAPVAARNAATRLAAGTLAAAALLALGVATSAQVRTWRDSETLFRHALKVTERNHVAHINLGLVHFERGELDAASAHLMTAQRIAPASSMAHGLLGNVRFAQGRIPEALAELELALAREPEKPRWIVGYATALLASERAPEAVVALERGLALDPDSAALRAHLGRALAAQGRLDEARVQLDAALAAEPASVEIATLRARVLGRSPRPEEAIAAYRDALRLGADAPDLRNDLAWLLATSGAGGPGAAAEALALAEQAVAALGGRDASALDTLAAAQAAAARHSEASDTARRAVALAETAGDAALAAQIRERLAGYEAEARRAGAPPSSAAR